MIDAQAAHDDDEPRAHVVDLGHVDAQQPRERLLHDVFGVGNAADHPVGDVEQEAALLLPDVVDGGVR